MQSEKNWKETGFTVDAILLAVKRWRSVANVTAPQYIWHIDTECHNNILHKNESAFGSPNIYYSFAALHMAGGDTGE